MQNADICPHLPTMQIFANLRYCRHRIALVGVFRGRTSTHRSKFMSNPPSWGTRSPLEVETYNPKPAAQRRPPPSSESPRHTASDASERTAAPLGLCVSIPEEDGNTQPQASRVFDAPLPPLPAPHGKPIRKPAQAPQYADTSPRALQ